MYPFFPSGVIVASDINQGLLVLTADSIDFAPVNPNLTPDATLMAEIPSPFCEGETALLTAASGEDTYQWYKDGQPISINQNFLFVETSGNYYVEITDGQCNAVSEEIAIAIESSPDLSSMPSGDYGLCANEVLTLEAPDTLDQYIWLKNGSIYQQGGNTLEVTDAGDYSLIAYLGGCNSTSEIISVSILDVPDAIILNQDLSLCEGDQLMLEANSGGDLYTWYLDNIEIGQTQGNNYSITAGGNYQVQVTIGGCSGLSEEVNITAYERPDVSLSLLGLNGSVDSNQVYLCYSESFVLAVPSDPSSQFQWYKNGALTGTNSNTLEISEEGEYYVEALNNNDCSNQSELIEVSISQPIAYIQFDGALLTNVDMWASYQWYLDGTLIVDATESSYAPSSSGEYHCVIINDVGCESVSNYIQVIIEGIENITSLISFSVYPNPVNDILNIELNTSERQSFDVQIIHANGQVMTNKNIDILGLQNVTFNLSDLPSGVYFIQLKTDDKQAMQRFVKI